MFSPHPTTMTLHHSIKILGQNKTLILSKIKVLQRHNSDNPMKVDSRANPIYKKISY